MLILSRNPDLQQLVAVWPLAPRSQLDHDLECAVPDHMRTRWLWAVMEPDPIPHWIRQAGFPDADHIRRLCYLAIDNLMVYPDGEQAPSVIEFFLPPKPESREGNEK